MFLARLGGVAISAVASINRCCDSEIPEPHFVDLATYGSGLNLLALCKASSSIGSARKSLMLTFAKCCFC